MAENEDLPRTEHFAALARMFQSEKYSDLKITCGSDSYKVHKAIVCLQSEFFDLACRPDSFKEGEESIVRLKASDLTGWDEDADDPAMVKQMIYYLYHLNYLPEEQTPGVKDRNGGHVRDARDQTVVGKDGSYMYKPYPEAGHLVSHAKMYALGDKYGIPSLKVLALDRYKASAKHHWNTADFADSIPIIYRSTLDLDKELREAAVEVVHEHIKELIKKPEIDSSLAEIQGLAYSLYRKQLGV